MQADLFCRVVDNYGDIGVSWRIARQLHHEHGWQIRLWVDDLAAFKRIEPGLDVAIAHQEIRGVDIRQWCFETSAGTTAEMPSALTALTPYPIVIAAFSCDLPETWVAAMQKTGSTWINLEYLSAEAWVENCHGLPSLRQDGLKPYFFFPGFTNQTGGLPREKDLIERRQAWKSNPAIQSHFLSALGLPLNVVNRIQHAKTSDFKPGMSAAAERVLETDMPRLVSLFCYPHAPYQALLEALQHHHRFSILLVPEGVCPGVPTGQFGQVQVRRIPFLSQDEYDQLLWTCDLNFVRGEDSFMRATWAGKPFVWQIYPQQEDAHLTKLDAWLARAQLSAAAEDCQRSWNHPHHPVDFMTALSAALQPDAWQEWEKNSNFLSNRLANVPDLAGSIAAFCGQSNIHPDRIK